MLTKNFLIAAGLAAALAVPSFAQTADKFQTLSRDLVAEADVAMHAGKADDAKALYERALAANPANVAALTGLGHVAEAQGLVGRGLKYYRKALEVEPNDQPTLEAQALAFLKRNMPDRAQDNLEKLSRLCLNGCEALTVVTTAIDAYHADRVDVAEGPNKEG